MMATSISTHAHVIRFDFIPQSTSKPVCCLTTDKNKRDSAVDASYGGRGYRGTWGDHSGPLMRCGLCRLSSRSGNRLDAPCAAAPIAGNTAKHYQHRFDGHMSARCYMQLNLTNKDARKTASSRPSALCLRACRDVRLVSLRGEPDMDREEVETAGTGGMVDGTEADGADKWPPLAPQNLSSKATSSTLDRVLVQILAVSCILGIVLELRLMSASVSL